MNITSNDTYKEKYLNITNYILGGNINKKRITIDDVIFVIIDANKLKTDDKEKELFNKIKSNNDLNNLDSFCDGTTTIFSVSPNTKVFFALTKNYEVVGYMHIHYAEKVLKKKHIDNFVNRKGLYIENVCANNKYSGVAKLMLNNFIENIETYYEDIGYLVLDVMIDNCPAYISYKSVGFIPTGNAYYFSDLVNAIGMIKFLYKYDNEKYCNKKIII